MSALIKPHAIIKEALILSHCLLGLARMHLEVHTRTSIS